MRWGRRRLPGDDAGGRQLQQVLDGVAMARLPASHPTQQGLTLITHTQCAIPV